MADIVLVVVVLFFLIWIFLRRQITSPLEALSGKALSIVQNEASLGSTVEVKGASEIEHLATTFNALSTSLKKERDELDLKVREKTQELFKASELLREKEEKMRLLINSKSEAIYSMDMDGNCIFCNDSCASILGYESSQQLLGQNIHNLVYQKPMNGLSQFDEACSILSAISNRENIHKEEDVFRCADGETLEVEWWAAPIIKDDEVMGGVVTFKDVNEHKKQHARDIRANQLAALGEMAAGVAHEINNPISGIINYTQLLENKARQGSYEEEVAGKIKREGWRIARIVEKLLSHARDEEGRVEPVDVAAAISDTLSLVRKSMEDDGITTKVDINDDVPMITINKQELEQVFMNLLTNARHALNEKFPGRDPEKVVEISLQGKVVDGNRKVVLNVRDHGTGISPNILHKIMQPFFTTKPVGQGTGIGLSLTREIIHKYQGEIHFDSEEGGGTSVEVSFPVDAA